MTNAELDAKLEKFMAETDARIVKLGERVVTLETGAEGVIKSIDDQAGFRVELEDRVAVLENAKAAPVPTATGDDYIAAIDKLHIQLFGVPVGAVQSLKD